MWRSTVGLEGTADSNDRTALPVRRVWQPVEACRSATIARAADLVPTDPAIQFRHRGGDQAARPMIPPRAANSTNISSFLWRGRDTLFGGSSGCTSRAAKSSRTAYERRPEAAVRQG